ncbi:hypothetical protein, partial [Curtobacterium sp. Csp2]|uniref:hypothetical protein n=1 Tax=Curtobacterium sp. Csp2 TaxID=2495430 RepID=UPI001C2E6C0D
MFDDVNQVRHPVDNRIEHPFDTPERTRAHAPARPRAAYETAVEVCRAEIREGNAFQVCLTTAFAVGLE